MRVAHAKHAAAVLALGLTGVAVGACGGDDADRGGSVPAAPPLTVPGYSGTPKVSKPKAKAPGADTTAAASARADDQDADPAATDSPTEANPSAAETTTATGPTPSETTIPPSSGADAATQGEFQAFCANNPGAC